METKNIDEKVVWNMGAALSMELARLREESNRYFVARNLAAAVECLISMRLTTCHTFQKNELDNLISLEDKLLELIAATQKQVQGFESEKDFRDKGFARFKLYKAFMNYNTELSKLLDSYGFLGNKQKDNSRLVA